MSDDFDTDEVSQRRRRVLQAFGVGAAATALGSAGVVGARSNQADDGDGLDPNLGFAALTPETDLPVEPDHEVQLLVGPPREQGRPLPEFFYQPTGLAVEPGDVVAFRFTTPGHTVSAYHPYAGRQQRIPDDGDGLAWFSSPYLGGGATWLYRFDTPGVYDYYCGPHEVFGHAGRIVVGDATEAPPVPDPCAPPAEAGESGEGGGGEGENADGAGGEEGAASEEGEGGGGQELRPPALTSALVLRDPALDPQNIVDSGAVGWEEIAQENKQLFVEFVTPDVCGLPAPEPEPSATAYQVDLVLGEPEAVLGEDPDDFYGQQGRLLRYLHGSSETPVVRTGTGGALDDVADCLDSDVIAVADGTATVTLDVQDGCEETVSLVSYVNPAGAGTFDPSVEQESYDATTETVGPGEHVLSVALPGDESDGE
ncbi:plastocyanin/azurin family copper-binding protein [Halomarina salina]|uniref:Plastocyanin/azurin family copper-binding protein n=1 Tax=Halomarina salina TaxID=1872699 RepID=A0ABD5RQL9_9EURY|nr:plastocyanin/azurin family copper-binding protein [Halomarina salina]